MELDPFQDTDGSDVYKFSPVSSNTLIFSVKTGGEAHIALTSSDEEIYLMYEISIGEERNKKLTIKRNKSSLVECESSGFLNANEFRSFWIRFSNNEILVGNESSNFAPLLIWNEPDLLKVTHFGIRTSSGCSGSWIFSKCWKAPVTSIGRWVKASSGDVPPEAVPAGYDHEQQFVARVHHDNGIIPGKLHPSHGVAYYPLDRLEMRSSDYEVLCEVPNPVWKLVRNEDVPPNAILGGISCAGEFLYVGRVSHHGTITVGNVKKNFPGCLFSYGGRALSFDVYEVLCSS